MDPHSIIDKGLTETPAQAESAMRGWPGTDGPDAESGAAVRFPGEDGGKSLSEMAERDLGATLQLLAERAQYITGATGAAIALRDGEELVCRASAGESAPGVGTLLQVNSGLSGESVRTGQTLVCEDATTDGRVNRESCQVLGIASVVVMPLLQDSLVIGVFELFSDQAHAFGERDLMALERLGSMVHTALDCARSASHPLPETAVTAEPEPATLIPLAPPVAIPPAAIPVAKAETPGNELFEAKPAPQSPSEAGATPARTLGPQLAFRSRIAFHGRTPAPGTVEPGATPAMGYGEGEEPAPLPTSGGEEAMASGPAEETPGPMEISDPAPFAAYSRGEQVPAQPTAPSMAAASEIVEMSASSAIADTAPPQARPAALVRPEPPVSAPADARDAVSDLFEAAVAPAPTSAAPAPARPAWAAPAAAPQALATEPVDAKARSEVASLGRCQTCGFPISPGRVLCLDCEKKARAEGKPVPVARAPEPKPAATPAARIETSEPAIRESDDSVPMFLAGEEEEEPDSWVSSHKYLVAAIAMAVMGVIALLLSR